MFENKPVLPVVYVAYDAVQLRMPVAHPVETAAGPLLFMQIKLTCDITPRLIIKGIHDLSHGVDDKAFTEVLSWLGLAFDLFGSCAVKSDHITVALKSARAQFADEHVFSQSHGAGGHTDKLGTLEVVSAPYFRE